MNFCGLNFCDTSNGDGVRVSLFVSGCRMHCKGCFNPESWDFLYGEVFTEKTKEDILKGLHSDYIEGFSLLGGDPFEPEHEEVLLDLLKAIKEQYPDKTIWCWTGRKLEKIKDSPLLKYIDVLIDGAFVEHLKDPNLKWRGSSNQRIIRITKEDETLTI